MSKDKRAEIVEAMARAMCHAVHPCKSMVAEIMVDATYLSGREGDAAALTLAGQFRVEAEAALDIALKAAAKILRQRIENYIEDHGIFDMETGATEFPGNGEDFVSDWEEIEEEILALTSEGPKY